ncbi:flavoprotein [Polymorphospora sp. NPDC050346]|uniref:flavoprotein n=1 Tax=Polymorphospora sp. NPDC050346 TaxID=3155780 RepID=UPI0033FC9C69
MHTHIPPTRTLHLVVCAAPPVRRIAELVDALQRNRWSVHVIATSTAATWLDIDDLATRTGHPVLHRQRHPDEPRPLPPADAVAVVPATFNTINKWAAGINDSLALGILNEALGNQTPTLLAPYAKTALTRHPAFPRHLSTLAGHGIHVLPTSAIRPKDDADSFEWGVVIDALEAMTTPG